MTLNKESGEANAFQPMIDQTKALEAAERASRLPAAIGPAAFLDYLMVVLDCRNDGALAIELEVGAGMISKIRSGRLGFGAKLQIKAHLKTGMPFPEMWQRIGAKL